MEDSIVGEIGELSLYSVMVLEGLDQSFALFVCEHSPLVLAVGVKVMNVVKYFLYWLQKIFFTTQLSTVAGQNSPSKNSLQKTALEKHSIKKHSMGQNGPPKNTTSKVQHT